MSGLDADAGTRTGYECGPERRIDGRDYDLHSVVVSYEDGPDRCTIYPRRKKSHERVESWLTANHGAFVGLEEMR
ncbi:DUF7511 domain-containing protein [Halegenticoccus tardaugens]|uniref:DUF7511 domain-containing protein n=1 Tax=Halegenticoccus tardaugens TaxID=2071624 RepID=UPI00100BAF30|nr:hypothetical protein [Halegenticoccus tardaugens]